MSRAQGLSQTSETKAESTSNEVSQVGHVDIPPLTSENGLVSTFDARLANNGTNVKLTKIILKVKYTL